MESEDQLRVLMDKLPDGVVFLDQQGLIKEINSAGMKLLDIHEDTGGQPLFTFILDQGWGQWLRVSLQKRRELRNFQTTFKGLSGQTKSLQVSLFILKEREGYLCLLRDVTEKVELQQQLLQNEKLSALGQIISGVAHELNNPLTSVMGYAQLLLEADLSPNLRRDLEKIYQEAQRCCKTIRNLLDFARFRRAEKGPIDINSLMENTLSLREYQLLSEGIQLKRELSEEVLPCYGDYHMLQQVFLNIINNSEQAILEEGSGGGLIEVKTEALPDGVRIVIKDSGPGIPLEVMHKVFDPFFTTKPSGKGTGLGLSLSQAIIKEHGGTIYCCNAPAGQKGSQFIIKLPTSLQTGGVESLPEEPIPVESKPPSPQPKRVLVVDDEESILRLLQEIIEDMGYSVEIALDGIKALEVINSQPIDLVITDIKMPCMRGQQLYEEIIKEKPSLQSRIIFSTGDTLATETEQFLTSKGLPRLDKPYDLAMVRKVIRQLLEQ